VGPSLSTELTAADIAAIECPFERAALVTQIARRCGTLPRSLYDLRVAALLEVRRSNSLGEIAKQVGLSRARIFQLTRLPRGAPKP